MKWLKHMNDAIDDSLMVAAIEEQGLVIFAVYWAILGEVAKHYKPNGEESISASVVPEWEHTLAGWARICHLSNRKFRKYAECLARKNLIGFSEVAQNSFETSSKLFQKTFVKFQICVPNMLKFHDEYSKKSEVSSEPRARAKKLEVRRVEEYRENRESSVSADVFIKPQNPPPPPASRVAVAAAAIEGLEMQNGDGAEPEKIRQNPDRTETHREFSAHCVSLGISAPSPSIALELRARYPDLAAREAATKYPRFPGQQSPGLWRSKTAAECATEIARQQSPAAEPVPRKPFLTNLEQAHLDLQEKRRKLTQGAS